MQYFQQASFCWTMCLQEGFYISHTNELACMILKMKKVENGEAFKLVIFQWLQYILVLKVCRQPMSNLILRQKVLSQTRLEDISLKISQTKQPTLGDATTAWFHHQNDIWETSTEIPHWNASLHRLVLPPGKFYSTNQKYYVDLGSDASSVWNFCTCFSDITWRGNQWQRRPMSAVFTGYLKI